MEHIPNMDPQPECPDQTPASSSSSSSANILSLPDELLVEIFDAVARMAKGRPGTTGATNNRATGGEGLCRHHAAARSRSSSDNDIANARLACRRFAATSSHLLLPTVRLPDLSSASLDLLDDVADHPLVGKGVRAVRLSTRFYHPALAGEAPAEEEEEDSIGPFAWCAINRVFGAAVRCQEEIQAQRRQVEELGCGISEALFARWMGEIASLEAVMKVLRSWSKLTTREGREGTASPLFPPGAVAGHNTATTAVCDEDEDIQHEILLRLAHALYRTRYQDQQELLADENFVERFSQAMARMPNAKVLEVTDFNYEEDNEDDEGDCSVCKSISKRETEAWLQGETEEVDLYDSLLDIDSFIQPMSWEDAMSHRWSTTPPVELWFTLPVALQEAGAKLEKITYSTGVCTEAYYPLIARASTEDFSNLGSAVKDLGIKSFAFLQADEEKPFARKAPMAKDVHAFKNFIKAMSSSDQLERLRIRLGGGWVDGSLDPDHQHNLGDLLWPAPAPASPTTISPEVPALETQTPWGQNLRDISFTGIPFTISDLDNMATHLRESGANLEFLSLSRPCLISGSWRHALDILRGMEVSYDNALFAPVGAECDDITLQLTGKYELIFCAEPGWGSAAECYINGETKRNPLASGWAVDHVYAADEDVVIVSVVPVGGDDSEDEEDDDQDEEETDNENEGEIHPDEKGEGDSGDDEDTEVGDGEEPAIKVKDVEDPMVGIPYEHGGLDELPSAEYVEFVTTWRHTMGV